MQLMASYLAGRPDIASADRVARGEILWDNIIVLVLLIISGHVRFTEGKQAETGLLAAAALFTVLLEHRRRFTPHPRFVAVLGVFAAIQIWQAASFRYVPLVTFMGFFARLYVAYAAVSLVRDFPRVYVNVMVFVCLASLCFYIPDQVCQAVGLDFRAPFDSLHRWIGARLEHRYDIGLYNFQVKYPHRNSGFFWEPGAFAGFALVALVFLRLARTRISSREDRIALLLFSLSILTTFSTMGYIVLPIALSLHMTEVIGVSRKQMQTAVLCLCLLPAAWFSTAAVWKLEFLSTKIASELSHVEMRQFTAQGGRLASFFFHEPYIRARPVAGWGRNLRTYLALDPYLERNPPAGNGVLRFVHEMGLAGLFTYLLATAGSIHALTRHRMMETAVILGVIVLTLQGEEFLTGALYLSFMFLGQEP